MSDLNNNNPFELFTEGIIGDALGAARRADTGAIQQVIRAENDSVGNMANTLNTHNQNMQARRVTNQSIIARARNSIIQFPIYISQSIRVNEAHIISKLFERVYVSYVQTALSQNQIIDEDEANNLVFLKSIHTNLKEAADVLVNKYYEPIDDVDAMLCESIHHIEQISENCTVEFSVVPTTNKDLIAENSRLMNEPLTGFAYLREDTERSTETNSITQNKLEALTDKDLEDIACERSKISKSTRETASRSDKDLGDLVKSNYPNAKDADFNKKLKSVKTSRDNARNEIDNAVEDLKKEIKNGKIPGLSYKNGKYCRDASTTNVGTKTVTKVSTKDKAPVQAPKLLRDADIKKINGMLPYTMEASFRIRQKDGTLAGDVTYVIGVKSVLHLIRAQDLSEDLDEIITGNIRSLQKIRYKTGEINFKDYFLNIKGIKSDVLKSINYNKKWLNTLKRLAEYNRLHGTLLKKPAEFLTDGKVPIPNGTLILSQLDVTNIVGETGIDISDVSIATKLVNSLFLIGIAIVDGTAGSMRVLFPDSSNDWDVQSLAAIDADIAKTDNSSLMKELMKSVNK